MAKEVDVRPTTCSCQYAQTSVDTDEATNSGNAKSAIVKKLWARTGIEVPMMVLAMKGALPPIICLAAYQADAWSQEYTTLGYLTAVISILAMSILPQAKFIQSMVLSLFFTCLGAAVALLEIQCTVAARQNTTPSASGEATSASSPGSQQLVVYNPSANAVAGVFLFLTIYTANSLRAYRPQMALPLVQYSIFTIIASTSAAQFPNMKAGEAFVRRLLVTFLTGFGIATGVCLFVLPLTSRAIVNKELGGMIKLIQAFIEDHVACMGGVSTHRQDNLSDIDRRATQKTKMGGGQKTAEVSVDGFSAEMKAMKGLIEKIGALSGKIDSEFGFAKREVAYGKLRPSDYSRIKSLLRDILIPILGIYTVLNMVQLVRVKEDRKRAGIQNSEILDVVPNLDSDEWDEIMEISQNNHSELKAAMLGGLHHIAYFLEFAKKPRAAPNDEENVIATPHATDSTCAAHLEETLHAFHVQRVQGIQRWCETKGDGLLADLADCASQRFNPKDQSYDVSLHQQCKRQQLCLMLYLGRLNWSMGNAILQLVHFADSKVDDGTMKTKRLVIPRYRMLTRFVTYLFKRVDSDDVGNNSGNAGSTIRIGDMLKPKDSEHLPPTNLYQKVTTKLRVIPRILGSNASAFGFRVAAATLSIGITAYLLQTYVFFVRERVLWALTMVALGMSAQAGQGLFGFAARILGTTAAMCVSIVLWYMGGKQTAAILVLFYICLCFGVLLLIKKPERAIAVITSMITAVIIIGYELQERKIGLAATTSTGQPYYPIYVLGPYRLATVCTGLAVAFIWTYFPYPITTHRTVRRDLGATLFLLANFYSCIHMTIELRLHRGTSTDPNNAKAPMTALNKVRYKLFGQCITMLNRLREDFSFLKFEPTFGGKFPKEAYDELVASVQRIFYYMSFISYSSGIFEPEPVAEENDWLKDFRYFVEGLNLTSDSLTSTLCLLSASVANAQPLPPHLTVPNPIALTEKMKGAGPELLSIRHLSEQCYVAFSALEVASILVAQETSNIVKMTQELMGEITFSNLEGSSTRSTRRDAEELL